MWNKEQKTEGIFFTEFLSKNLSLHFLHSFPIKPTQLSKGTILYFSGLSSSY